MSRGCLLPVMLVLSACGADATHVADTADTASVPTDTTTPVETTEDTTVAPPDATTPAETTEDTAVALTDTTTPVDTREEPDAPDTTARGTSLRFFGAGVGDIDRVKIPIDDPTNDLPGPPADVGATDFTLELWVRGALADNTAGPRACGDGVAWIYGNILLDRDRYAQGRKLGVSFVAGRVIFGVSGVGDERTVCGDTVVLDGAWHHLAVQRRRSDGLLEIWVDGRLDGSGDGPDGDVSYPDDGVPGDFCGGPCTHSDPYLVVAAEKHDAGAEYPSFAGWVDELRISTRRRYTAPFTPPSAPFAPDADTAALYHFDEGAGTIAFDTSGAAGGPSDGVLMVGGDPLGPAWSDATPFD